MAAKASKILPWITLALITLAIVNFFIRRNRVNNDLLPATYTDETAPEKPWAKNSLHGFSFYTPGPVKKEPVQKNHAFEKNIRQHDIYLYKDKQTVCMFLFMDTDFESYDTKAGLTGIISNTVRSFRGTDLTLNFSDTDSVAANATGEGLFRLNGKELKVKGSIRWHQGKIAALVVMMPNDLSANDDTIDKIIESLKMAR